MTGFPFNVRWPKLIGVHLTGELNGWSAPKDVILEGRRDPHRQGRHRRHRRVLRSRRRQHQRHRQGHHLQHGRRDRRHHLVFGYDDNHEPSYLKATGREAIADAADAVAAHLRPDDEVLANPADYFDQVIEIDLTTLQPLINGPHTPTWPARCRPRRRGPRATAGRSRSAPPSSARAPTPPTRTSPGRLHRPPGAAATGCR
jgi:aconitate hydratase